MSRRDRLGGFLSYYAREAVRVGAIFPLHVVRALDTLAPPPLAEIVLFDIAHVAILLTSMVRDLHHRPVSSDRVLYLSTHPLDGGDKPLDRRDELCVRPILEHGLQVLEFAYLRCGKVDIGTL